MKLECYALSDNPPQLVPADAKRQWMSETNEKFAYRCLPLNIANAFGWDILCPLEFEAEWNGDPTLEAISFFVNNQKIEMHHLVSSHFGYGIMTFHVGYLFRTNPGVNLLATGPLNRPKNLLYPLSGVVETDWLSFTFTMNWKFTAPGRIKFEKDEPICTVIPFPGNLLDSVEPEIYKIEQNPKLKEELDTWSTNREKFLVELKDNPPPPGENWQKDYFRGKPSWQAGDAQSAEHKSKLRLKTPVDKRN